MAKIKVKVSCSGECGNDDCEGSHSHEFPAKNEVCNDCEGFGTVLNSSMRNHGYTEREMREDFDDEERAEYFKRGGRYDVVCPTCKGNKVTLVIDRDGLSKDQQVLADQFDEDRAEMEIDARNDAFTRRMESGHWD